MIIPVVLFVSFLVFCIMDLVPGDAATTALGDEVTEEELEFYREAHGLNDPLPIQYLRYISGIFTKNLGKSVYNNADVWTLYFAKLPNTIKLAGFSLLLAVLFSVPMGILAAVKQNTWIDAFASAISFVGLAMPNFWVGLLLIMFFSVQLGLLPAQGASAGFWSLILPGITCGTSLMAAITRTTRSAMLDVINQDYLRTARSKGLPERLVITRHALKMR